MVEESFEETTHLLHSAAAGDRGALGRLFERCRGPLLRHVRSELDSDLRDFLESGDVLQDAFLDIVRAFERTGIRDEDSFLRWAARIATNNLRDHLRRRRLRSTERLTSTLYELGARFDGAPPSAAVRAERARELQDAIAQLPDDYRRAIELRDLAQRSYEEIAEIMGSPSPSAAQRLHSRAMARLVRIVKQRPKRSEGG